MADEIIKQGPGYVLYRTTEWGPAVPYKRIVHEDSVNHSFVDLRDQPGLIDQIPESSRSAGLRAILRALNAANSPFIVDFHA